jgi:Ser/Thr protein kinase RdoA (MazF antagonist)
MQEKKLIKPFTEISYLSQVRRLRSFAWIVLKQYRVNFRKLEFIHHGENATFKVTTINGSVYLLRVHRNDYHTIDAIHEELNWLMKIAESKGIVPKPVFSKNNRLVETISAPELDLIRNCCLFHWVDGKFINKSILPKHMYKIGELLARLQNHAPKTTSRRYWDADGLLGLKAKFGSIDSIAGASKKEQQMITAARKKTLLRLKKYQAKHPKRLGLIHADLHFGNLLAVGSDIGAIDFDDCGFGFYVYDLVVPYISMQNILGKKNKKKYVIYKTALINGYKSIKNWDQEDDDLFSDLVTARKLLMLGWLNSRLDNPKLKKHLKGAIKRALVHIRRENSRRR